MWEARAADGRLDDLSPTCCRHADPSAEVLPQRATTGVVVIDPTGHGLPEVPAELVARPPHVWAFERVAR